MNLGKMHNQGMEEERTEALFLDIMDSYEGSAMSPLSGCPDFRGILMNENGSSATERHKERNRRAKMNENYSVLRSMVPSLAFIPKPTKEKIVDDTIKYIRCLEEERQKLEGLKKLQENSEGRWQGVTRCTAQNNVNVTISNGITILAIELPFKRSLVTEIFKILEKHHAEILASTVTVNEQRLLTVTVTLMLGSGGDYTIEKIREEVLVL